MKIYTVVGKGMRKLLFVFLFASLAVTGAYAETYHCSLFPNSAVYDPTDYDAYDFRFFLESHMDLDCWDGGQYPTMTAWDVPWDPFTGSLYTSGGGDGYNLVCVIDGTCEYGISGEIRPVTSVSQCATGQILLDLNGFNVAAWVEGGLSTLYDGEAYIYDDNYGVTNFKVCVNCDAIEDQYTYGSWTDYTNNRQRRPKLQKTGALLDNDYTPWYEPYSGGCQDIQSDYEYQCASGYYVASGSGSSLSCSQCPVADNMCTVPLSGSSCSNSNKAQGTTDAGLAAITDCCVPVGTYYDTKGKYRTNTCCPYVQN